MIMNNECDAIRVTTFPASVRRYYVLIQIFGVSILLEISLANGKQSFNRELL